MKVIGLQFPQHDLDQTEDKCFGRPFPRRPEGEFVQKADLLSTVFHARNFMSFAHAFEKRMRTFKTPRTWSQELSVLTPGQFFGSKSPLGLPEDCISIGSALA